MIFHINIILILLILGFIIVGSKQSKVRKRFYLCGAFAILFFISAFRSNNIGNDTGSYINLFNLFGNSTPTVAYNSGIEAGYVWLNRFVFTINSEPLLLFIIISAFVLLSEIIFIYRHSANVWLSMFLFINLRLFYFTLSGLRQSIAIAFFLVGYKYILEKKFLKYSIFIIVASLFHNSAIFLLLLYPLSKVKLSKIWITIMSISAVIISLFFEEFLSLVIRILPRYNYYLASKYLDASIKLASVMEFLVMLVIFIFLIFIFYKYLYEKNRKTSLENNNEINIIMQFTFVGTLVGFLALNTIMLDRLLLYFTALMVVYLPNAINRIKDKNARILMLYIVILVFFAYNITILYFKPEWQHLYPYKFVF